LEYLVCGVSSSTPDDAELGVETFACQSIFAYVFPPNYMSEHVSRLVASLDTQKRERGRFTILDPRITEGVDTLSLILPNDNIPDSRSRQKIEHSIRIRPFSLLITSTLSKLVPLHSSIEGLTGLDIYGLIKHDGLSRDGELGHGEEEAWRWTRIEVALGCISTSLGSVAVLAADYCCCGEHGEERQDDGS
jgi:hypothetical protein